MDFERVLLSLIGLLVIAAVACLVSFARDRRRQRKTSIFATLPTPPAPARRKLPAPTIVEMVRSTEFAQPATDSERRYNQRRELLATMSDAEYTRRSNHGMY